MIKSIEIRGFQKHRRFRLELSPGITVIVGPSDAGKSSIVRALRWACFNRPSGWGFRNWKARQTQVTIVTDQGKIRRLRTKTRNEYRVNGKVLRAFGAGVPEEVGQVLFVSPTNIQSQHEGPFLLDRSPGEVAGHFNEVSGLDLIDRVTGGLKARMLLERRRAETHEERVAELDEQIARFSFLPEAKRRLLRLEQIEERLRSEKKDAERLRRWAEEWEAVHRYDLSRMGKTVRRGRQVLERARELKQLRTQHHHLTVLVELILQVRSSCPTDPRPAKLRLKKLSAQWEQRKDLQQQQGQLEALVSALRKVRQEIQQQRKRAQEARRRFHAAFPTVCPLCGSRWKE